MHKIGAILPYKNACTGKKLLGWSKIIFNRLDSSALFPLFV